MEPVPQTSVTIVDVASRAGVGVATVSRVLNGHASVRPATRARVLDAIDALDYRPSSVARSLSLGKSMVVAVILPWFTAASAVERVRGIVAGMSGSAYDVMLFDVESEDRQRRAFELFGRGDRADGLLIVSTLPPEQDLARLSASRTPCVFVDAQHTGLPSVVIDDLAGGELATRHLIELGHRRIAFIGDTPPEFRFVWSRDRALGYESTLERASIELRPEYVRVGTQLLHVARSIALELLQLPEPPTAIFAASDTQALGVLEAARSLGIDVPGQLSVIGFDDIEIAQYVGLTTVRQPLYESGRRGAELLLRALSGHALPAHSEQLPLELVVRRTTGPCG
jgi:DNA-binding LacI/PurR family transcriptional regulator